MKTIYAIVVKLKDHTILLKERFKDETKATTHSSQIAFDDSDNEIISSEVIEIRDISEHILESINFLTKEELSKLQTKSLDIWLNKT